MKKKNEVFHLSKSKSCWRDIFKELKRLQKKYENNKARAIARITITPRHVIAEIVKLRDDYHIPAHCHGK